MKYTQVAIACLAGGLAIYIEYLPIKEFTVFFTWIYSAPFVALCILALVFLILNIRLYVKWERAVSFLPSCICVVSIITVIVQSKVRQSQDNAEVSFTAWTHQIGDDGGLTLYFWENGHLKAERGDHWLFTSYWGEYHKKNDTIELNLPLNFKLGKKAILTDSSLRFIGDTISFEVHKPLLTGGK